MSVRWLLLACLVPCLPAVAGSAGFVPVAERAVVKSAKVTEASGMAVSRRDPSKLWLLNDSGAAAELHLTGTDGTDHGLVLLDGARNHDWEDLASFTLDGRPWLLVADVGDNEARRPERVLYLLEEPVMDQAGGRSPRVAPVARKIRFRYDGGPRDCEAVAVDVPGRRVILITKRTDPPEVHELPLDPPAGGGVATTRRTGTVRTPAPAGSVIPFRDQPTALDISADQSLAAVLTYYSVFVFARRPEESWAEAFSRRPLVLAPHVTAQAEALAFTGDGGSIFVASEGRNPPLVRYRRASGPTR